VPGTVIVEIFKQDKSNNLFCVAVVVVPPTSPVAVAVPAVVIS